MSRLLVVNADDFGFTRDVNEGIVAAHTGGILTATTLMANGAAFGHAIDLARRTPTLDVGVHLVLIGGESVLEPGRRLPQSIPVLLAEVAMRRLPLEAELDAQVRKVRGAGIEPTHLDTHKHTHLWPAVLEAVARLSRKHGIRWVRRPFDFPIEAGSVPASRRVLNRSFGFLRPRFHRILDRYGCRVTDHFAGFSLTGHFRTQELVELLAQLPSGSTELMTHPGYCTEELRAARTRLKDSRLLELEALTASETREALRRAGIRLVRYREME